MIHEIKTPKRQRVLIVATILCLGFAPVSLAALMVPSNLGPGGQYGRDFVTGTTTETPSTVILDYNELAIGGVAAAGGELTALGLHWRALEFSPDDDERGNTGARSTLVARSSLRGSSLGVPVTLFNDRRLVRSKKHLWDGRAATPFTITEFTVSTPINVHSGRRRDGTGFASVPLGQKNHLGDAQLSSLRRDISSTDEDTEKSTLWAWLKYPLWVIQKFFEFMHWLSSILKGKG